MPAINTTSGLAPGKIVYHVYGGLITKKYSGKSPEELIEKLVITSFPQHWHYSTKDWTPSLYINVIRNSPLDGGDWRSGNSLRDCGIGGNKYNLNRIFATKYEALEFISECMIGKFFDKEDQEVYNRLITEENYWNSSWAY